VGADAAVKITAKLPLDVFRHRPVVVAVAAQMPDVREYFAQQALDSSRHISAEFATMRKSEVPTWTQASKDSGAKAEWRQSAQRVLSSLPIARRQAP
jgi:hypothetical protein